MSKAEDKAKIAYQFWDISPNNYREYKGFVKGYQQAEKDLALTWEDVKRIVEIADKLCPYTSKDIAEFQENFQTEEAYYKEVLRRFNEAGGGKNL